MYLKRLDIQGFKTFADKTQIVFTPGITAVVGPNGSGKSNIADAVLWVLGEGNVRSLRGQTSQDVIFAGNAKRRPVGLAEVSLTIDNSSKILPLEFSEVTVTRRVYRSGEGECFINRVPCRLRDVVELFMDTGLGRDAYSMVSQSEIDAILSVRSEDRRAIFEEAAGITKYRHRKREAVRKLENTRQNLLRVNDIVGELESQLRPLARQAQVARRYREISGRLQELELAWLSVHLRRLGSERERLEELVAELTVERDRVGEVLEALREEETTRQDALRELEGEGERLRQGETRCREAMAQGEKDLSLARERVSAAERRREGLAREARELAERIVAAQQRAEAAEAERRDFLARIGELKGEMATKTAEAKSAADALEVEARALEAERARMLELARRQASARNQLAHLERQDAALAEAIARLTAEKEEATAEAARLGEALVAEEARIPSLAEAVRDEETELETVQRQLSEAQSAWKASSDAAREAEQAWRSAAARHTALAEMRDSFQGYEEGVRALLKAARDGQVPGTLSPLMDALHVPAELERAVEAALGPCAQAIVTDTVETALAAARLARERAVGRVALLPASWNGNAPSPDEGAALTPCPSPNPGRGEPKAPPIGLPLSQDWERGLGGEGGPLPGLATSLAAAIHPDPTVVALTETLLGRVRLADDLDTAVRSVVSSWHAVTTEGDLVTDAGAIHVGCARDEKERTKSVLARRRELQQLAQLEAEAEGTAREATATMEAADAERERLRTHREERARHLEQVRSEHAAAVKALERLRGDEERARRQAERLARQWQTTCEERREAQEEHAAVTAQLTGSDTESASLEGALESRQAAVQERRAALRLQESTLADLRVELASLEERARAAGAAAQRAIDARSHAERAREAAMGEEVTLEADLVRLAEQIETLEAGRASHEERLEALLADLETCKGRHASQREALQAMAARLAAEADRRTELMERAHRAELEHAAADAEWSHLVAHLEEEYELTPELLGGELSADQAASEVLSKVADPQGEIARLRRQIKSLGAVNPDAVEEHAQLSERYEFLSTQRADLEQAQEQLHQAIREIDATTRDTFMTAYRQIGAAFQEMFQRLFGGGQTELVLTDPTDVLETGIDILVQPPGKKRQNLLLLSGGERALTASALLFALLQVRPSPFCVLDEVDAPLDEANVSRFGDVLREFARNSQFIVVTHNRGTMEVADTLYGVTMEEAGVSKVVSVRLSDVAGQEALPEPEVERLHPLAAGVGRR
jgi:chromosome segregation protein